MRTLSAARTGVACLLTLGLSIACVPSVLARAQEGGFATQDGGRAVDEQVEKGSSASFDKSEVVYASLGADGAAQEVFVVNRFEVSEPGVVVDFGDYEAVSNLTNQSALERTDEATVFDVEEGTFFYQGNAGACELPWTVQVTYELDGQEVDAACLAGASGSLSIHLTCERNRSVTVDESFFECYMVQVSFTLPGDAVRDVVTEGATVALSGQDRTVAFTALPGAGGDFTLSAQVSDFEMSGIQIAALPYTSVIDMPEVDGIEEGMTQLASAVGQLSEGSSALADGVSALESGTADLSAGAQTFGEGLCALDASSGELVGASSEINGALLQAAGALEAVDVTAIDDLDQLLEAIRGLCADIREAVDETSETCTALGNLMEKIEAAQVTEEQLARLRELIKEHGDEIDEETLARLEQAAESARVAAAAWESGLRDSFDQVIASNENLAQIVASVESLAGKISVDDLENFDVGQIKELVVGLQELAGAYGQFHGGLVSYTDGVAALAQGYTQLEEGTAALSGGVGQLASGANALSSGMAALDGAVVTIPEAMRAEIERMMADYEFPEFEPISFTSSRNENVAEVQFVLTTAAIEKPVEPEVEEEEPELTLLDRLAALF